MALVRVPFYFINLLPISLLYISILLAEAELQADRLVDKKGKRPKNRKMLKARMAASKILKDRRQAGRLLGRG